MSLNANVNVSVSVKERVRARAYVLAYLKVVGVVGVVADHELIEAKLEVLEVGFVQCLPGDLVAHDLGADVIFVV